MVVVKDGKLELLTDKNSTLVLVDYQPAMFAGVASGDKALIRTAATCAAKAASILDVPVVLSAIRPSGTGSSSRISGASSPSGSVFPCRAEF